MFPRAVRGFAGRRAELARIAELIDREVLFLVYGIGGIGKTELVYRAIGEALQRDAWRDAVPILIDVRPGMTVTRALAQLLSAVGAGPEPRRGQPTEEAHLGEQLEVVARALDAGRYILFADDVHHLPAAAVGEALHYLARRVHGSRIFVASRHEIPLPPDAPPPVVTTLGPLDEAATEELMDALAERMQVPRPDPAALFRATHGSPFFIRHALGRPGSGATPLDESLSDLSAAAHRVLLAAAIAQHRLAADALRRARPADGALDDALRELAGRFLIDLDQGHVIVHDLIREALLQRVDPEELTAAHAEAADMCVAQLAGAAPALIHVVEAVGHYLAAGRAADAWALIERWHSALAAAGTEHLLQAPLDQLRRALPDRQVAIDLLIARHLVRASLIEEAGRALARIGEHRTPAEDARYHALAGEIAQRTGDLASAERLLQRAEACAPDDALRFSARLQRANAAAIAGDGDRARALLDAGAAELAAPAPRQRARAGWVRTVSWMFDERYELAADQARRTRARLTETGASDVTSRLAMLETLARIECDDMHGAREAAAAIDAAGLRQRVAGLYRAIASYADGDCRAAARALVEAHDYMHAHGDTVNAYIAGYYGSGALAAIGSLGDAQALIERVAGLARRAGMHSAAAQALSQQAMLAAEAVQSPVAHRLADAALAADGIAPRSCARAHCAHARAYTIEGDISRALHHITHARAAITDADLDAVRQRIDREQAVVELVGGNLQRAVELAERAAAHYRDRSSDYEAAHAQLVAAASYVARGRRADAVFAERAIATARELADRGELRSIQVGCAILTAALAKRAHRDRAADELLADALRELGPERGSIYAGTLLAAIEGSAVAAAIPGAVALLAHLGLTEAVEFYIVDQHGRRAATTHDVARERNVRDLFVDEVRAVIVARRGEVEIPGRPMQCALLSSLVQARGEPVSPAALYKRVWGGDEYHPLQHRNALYVAINRLRASLRDALPGGREIIERASNGWRLPPEIDACVVIAARDPRP